ncbi:MAG: response regulator transcription factor [Lachnospiraceae bacterium]|nr:response regulator transcription factor [Lachnospiraceae bacterium]
MKIAIVDDEKVWRLKTKQAIDNYLKSIGELTHISMYTSGEHFLEQPEAFDMVFMDVEMDGIDGFQTINSYKQIFPKCLVAILTTHSEFYSIGYRVNAFRYIEKERMAKEIKEALSSGIKLLEKDRKISFHIVNIGEIELAINEILFIETAKRNVRIHTREQQYLSNRTISEIGQELDKYGFYFVHKSTLVNLEAITEIDTKNRKVCLCNGNYVTVAGQKIPELKKRYLEHKFTYGNG